MGIVILAWHAMRLRNFQVQAFTEKDWINKAKRKIDHCIQARKIALMYDKWWAAKHTNQGKQQQGQ